MDEEMKKRLAVFRFGVIADFVNGRQLQWGEVDRLMREKCAQRWLIPGSARTRISESTIKDWIQRYKNSGNNLESLYPRDRCDCGKPRAIDPETAAGLIALKKEMPAVRLPVLMKEAQHRKIILPGKRVTYSCMYRLLLAEGLLQNIPGDPKDRRRFEAENPNDLWQSDIMHGPYVTVEGKQRKTYLLCFLDDMSRLICHADFYLHERLGCFLDSFRQALLKRGIPRKLYVDNGSAFRSHHLEHTCASLGIVLIHSKPYQPEGRGKVERVFRTVREQFLSIQKITTLESLNEALRQWIDSYNDKVHSITKEAPLKRFTRNIDCVRPAPKDLEDHFRTVAKRTVAKDRTIALAGRLYEAPVALIGKRVNLLYHEHDPARVEILYNSTTYGFAVVLDVNVNCRIKRGKDTIELDGDDTNRYGGGKLFGNGDDTKETE
ncbi:MAG: DDE-type integrase/transposase/recombinase [Dissulfurispiraceae bacterium]|jgi:transposase InsO family protein